MKVHFICRGNVYRSRMAEAYFKSLVNNQHQVSSSGIEASLNLNGKVDPVAVDELQNDGIVKYLAPSWRQTTQTMLDEADIVVYMSSSLSKNSKALFNVNESKSRVWEVPDKDNVYTSIKDKVDALVHQVNN